MIAPYKIEWNKYSSVDKNIITELSFNGDDGEVETHLGRELVASDVYDGSIKKGSLYKWSESLTPKFTFIKEGFGDFTPEENRDILSWLTGKKTPGFLTVYMDDSNVVYEILGNWTNIQQYKLGASRIVGYVCEFTSLAPYAFSCLETKEINGADLDNNTLTIDIHTDEIESAIYPRITIKQNNDSVIVPVAIPMINDNAWIDDDDWLDGVVYARQEDGKYEYYYQNHYTITDENGDEIVKSEPTKTVDNPVTDKTRTGVIIKNTYVDGDEVAQEAKLKIANNTRGENIIIDGANRVISSDATSRIFGDDFIGWSWMPLYNGENKIKVIGNCTVTIEYREVRKIGEY